MIEKVNKYLRKCKSISSSNWYWFELKDDMSEWAFYVRNNKFYFCNDKVIWLEAIKFIEMIGDDWDD